MAIAIITRAEARAQGLTRYFSGVPCKRQHIAERSVASAACCLCRDEAQAEWRKLNRERLRAQENSRNAEPEKRQKRLARRAAWREKNREKLREQDAVLRASNPEKAREKSRRHYAKDPEKGRARAKRWREENLDKRKAYLAVVGNQKNKEWREAHKDELKAYYARWQKENRDRVYAKIHKRRAIKKASGGTHTADDIAEIMKAQNGCCAYCKTDLKRSKRHIDHIVPLSLGGSNARANIQITCARCNTTKGAKDPIEFAQSLGLLL